MFFVSYIYFFIPILKLILSSFGCDGLETASHCVARANLHLTVQFRQCSEAQCYLPFKVLVLQECSTIVHTSTFLLVTKKASYFQDVGAERNSF